MLDNFCLLSIIKEVTFLTFVNEVASLRKMRDDRSWMYDGWKSNGMPTREWMVNT
jgi:hypothetical protein